VNKVEHITFTALTHRLDIGRVYLASPYTHPSAIERCKRWMKVMTMTAHLTKAGVLVFSPIVHGHPLINVVELPRTTEFWARIYDTFLLHWAQVLVVHKIDGWKHSEGVKNEMRVAEEIGLSIYLLEDVSL
jgi:hypothetical protein